MAKPVTIKDVKVILTQPAGSRLVIVKVITSEPGLYGLGCATFTQRFHAVVAALETPQTVRHRARRVAHRGVLADVDGPQLLAQWPGAEQCHLGHRPGAVGHQGQDGGYARLRAAGRQVPRGGGGLRARRRQSPEEVVDNVRQFMEKGYRHIRIQMGGYGGKGVRNASSRKARPTARTTIRASIRAICCG